LYLLGDKTANSGDFPIVHFAKEQERHVQILGFDPFHIRPGSSQIFLEGDSPIPNGLADIDANERA
jgi:hypothetical protein